MATTYSFTIVGKDNTKAMFRSIKTGLAGVRRSVNSTQVRFAALAGVTGLGAVVKVNLDLIDSLAKTSDKLGLATEDLAALRHAAELTGNSQRNLDLGLQRMTRRIAEAAQGTGEAKKAIQELGLSAQALAGMTPDEQFRELARSFENVRNQSDRVRLGFKLFDSEGVGLVNTLALGAQGLQEVADEAEALGIAISRVDAAKVEDARDQLSRVGAAVRGIGQSITVQLAPIISVAAEQFLGLARDGVTSGKIVTKVISGMVKAVGVFADGWHGLKVIFKGVEVGAAMFASALYGMIAGLSESFARFAHGFKTVWLKALRQVIQPFASFSDKAAESLAEINAQLAAPVEMPPIVQRMRTVADETAVMAAGLRDELHELLMQDLPSAVFEQKWAEIQAEAELRAQETAKRIEDNLAVGGVDPEAEPVETDAERERREAQEQRERERIAARLQRLDEQYFTELEKLRAKYEEELAIIAEAEEAKTITEEQANQRRERAASAHEAAKERIAKAGAQARMSTLTSTLGQIMSFTATGSKKMFRVQKLAAIAQAAVAIPAAVVESFKNAGGYPWGIAPAAAMAAQGAVQMASIKRQSLTSGGGIAMPGGGGASGSTPTAAGAVAGSSFGNQFAAPAPAQDRPQTVVNFHVNGDVVGDTAETILGKMRTLIEENDAVLFSAGSRQAQELVPA